MDTRSTDLLGVTYVRNQFIVISKEVGISRKSKSLFLTHLGGSGEYLDC